MFTTSLTLKYLRKAGYVARCVERRLPKQLRTQDLWGADVLAFKPGKFLLVQTTTRHNLAGHIHKVMAIPEAERWLQSGGRFHVHGWSQPRGPGTAWKITIVRFGIRDGRIVQLQELTA